MFSKLAIIFIVIPIIELWLLLELGRVIDLLPTLAIIVTTGLLGAYLAKAQGRRAWFEIQRRLGRGELPGSQIVDGLLILVAAVVLITPGILTDCVGILLLIPPVRKWVRGLVTAHYANRIRVEAGRAVQGAGRRFTDMGTGPFGEGDVIDVTAESGNSGDRDGAKDKPSLGAE